MNSSANGTVVCILLGMLLAAVALVVLGLRGRRVGDHPTCRRCGFDLFGAPPEGTRCPECGADVRAPRAVAIGRRQRRAWPFAVAGALLILGALGLVGATAAIDWRARLPTWYVLREARAGNVRGRVMPIEQLLARDANGALAPEERVALARAILAVQRDPVNLWNPTGGDRLASRAIDHTLGAADADAFWANAFADCAVALRPTIRRGDWPPVRVGLDVPRALASNSLAHAQMDTADRALSIDGVDAGPPRGTMSFGVAVSGGPGSAGTSETGEAWRTLAVGPHTVEWACPIRVYAGPMGGGDRPAAPEVARVMLRWRGIVNVVDGEDVHLTPDPAQADAIRRAIGVVKLRLPERANYSPMLELRFGAMPVDVAFDVFARQGDGTEQKLTTVQRTRKSSPGGHSIGLSSVTLKPGVAELIFRASPDAARSTIDQFEIWDGEVRIPDVPVEQDVPWAPAIVRPTTRAAGDE